MLRAKPRSHRITRTATIVQSIFFLPRTFAASTHEDNFAADTSKTRLTPRPAALLFGQPAFQAANPSSVSISPEGMVWSRSAASWQTMQDEAHGIAARRLGLMS